MGNCPQHPANEALALRIVIGGGAQMGQHFGAGLTLQIGHVAGLT